MAEQMAQALPSGGGGMPGAGVRPGPGPLGRIFARRNQPPPAPPPPPPPPPAILDGLTHPPYPWTWSVLILGGLSLLSVLVLSNRIKSLDRLR